MLKREERKKTSIFKINVSKSNKMEIQDFKPKREKRRWAIIAEYRYNGTGQTPSDDIDF